MIAPGLSYHFGLEGELEVRFSGSWNQPVDLPDSQALFDQMKSGPSVHAVVFMAEDIGEWDSRLPTYVLQVIRHCRTLSVEPDCTRLPDGLRRLLILAEAVPERSGARRSDTKQRLLEQLGRQVLTGWNDLAALVRFTGEICLALVALGLNRARFRHIDFMIALEAAGPGAFPIVTLISLLVGLILAFVGAAQLAMFGAQIYIADLVGLGMAREMGALMTAIIMAGRTGAAYAAQLGTMNVNSEIDSLRTLGIAPVEFLVLPRLLALIVMMPLLGVYAVFVGIVGGWLVATTVFDISLVQFYSGIVRAVDLYDYGIGMVKCLSFAVLIALAGCMRGMQCGQSAQAVGEATTRAVVDSIIYIVLADSIITLICNRLGI
ncbi:MAG: MlaE family ABC transporter permease [Methylococcaceae bacterium]